jgi:protein-disulfide isomerase
MQRNLSIIALCATIALVPALVLADDEPSCKQQLDQVLVELRELRKLVEARGFGVPTAPPPPQSTSIDIGGAPFIGSNDAPITIVEFTDYQCPYCKQFFTQTFPWLSKAYIESGQVRFVVMNFPLAEQHKDAGRAANAAVCAQRQDHFWEMHDHMQANPDSLLMDSLLAYAKQVGMDADSFRVCIESEATNEAVLKARALAAEKGVQVTPTFVVGRTTPAGVDGVIIRGAVPLGVFEKQFRELPK